MLLRRHDVYVYVQFGFERLKVYRRLYLDSHLNVLDNLEHGHFGGRLYTFFGEQKYRIVVYLR